MKTAIVLPCYNVEREISHVVSTIPEWISIIILVNDCSRDKTLTILQQLEASNNKIKVLNHEINAGVGAAMKSGFNKAVELGADILVKVDGDGQMDTVFVRDFVESISVRGFDYVKGNRFFDLTSLLKMPWLRRIGNIGLSFLVKASSGYWKVADPTNGFIAISSRAWVKLDKTRLGDRFYFESSMLNELYYSEAKVLDIPIPAIYQDETSNLSIKKVLIEFPPKLFRAFVRRLLLKYFVYNFSVFSLYLMIGVPLAIFGSTFGLYHWIYYHNLNVSAPTGTVMIAVLSVVISFQLLLAVINHDITTTIKS